VRQRAGPQANSPAKAYASSGLTHVPPPAACRGGGSPKALALYKHGETERPNR